MADRVDGLLHDAMRPGRKKPLPAGMIERVVAMTLTEPPGEATHWTGRAMAKAAGISLRSVQRIWRAHGFNCCQMIEDHSSYDVRLVPEADVDRTG